MNSNPSISWDHFIPIIEEDHCDKCRQYINWKMTEKEIKHESFEKLKCCCPKNGLFVMKCTIQGCNYQCLFNSKNQQLQQCSNIYK